MVTFSDGLTVITKCFEILFGALSQAVSIIETE